MRRCGAARVVMRRRGAKHRAVCQHGGCNELRVKGPILHSMVGGGVGTHRESYDYDADAEGRAAQCE